MKLSGDLMAHIKCRPVQNKLKNDTVMYSVKQSNDLTLVGAWVRMGTLEKKIIFYYIELTRYIFIIII